MPTLAHHSAKRPRKARNGDHVLTRPLGGGTVLLAVADGVGSRPCDWNASETACRAMLETFGDGPGTLAGRIEEGLKVAHRRVRSEAGKCAGMLAALVVAAWRPDAEQVFFASVGDARIYHLLPGQTAQLTEDDVATERVRLDTRTSLPGAPPSYARRYITRAIGGPYDLAVDVQAAPLAPGDGLVLVSDGAYPLEGFERELRRVFDAGPLQQALDTWIGSDGLANEDDATVALLRRGGPAPQDRPAYLDLLERGEDVHAHPGLHAHLMLRVLLEKTRRSLKAGDAGRAERCLAYAQEHRLRPGREVLIRLLDRVAEGGAAGQGRPLFDRLRRLTRQQPF